MMDVAAFKFHDVSDFPVVRISGRNLPNGYSAQWAREMENLVANGRPFSLILLDGIEEPTHEDQKTQMRWLKTHKRELAAICTAIVSIEPDRTKRILKRAQGLAIAAAMGLRFNVAPNREAAEQRAQLLVSGASIADDDEN
jgi:hypothetical protein